MKKLSIRAEVTIPDDYEWKYSDVIEDIVNGSIEGEIEIKEVREV